MSTTSGAESSRLKPSRALFRQPLALQWREGRDIKKRHDHERQAGRFELFLDLLYVAILANMAENLAEHPIGSQVGKYILILTPAWHIWSDLRELMNSFYNDDLGQRTLILWVMTLLVMYGNNCTLVDEEIGAMRATVGAYLVARYSSNTTHLVYSFASYHHRKQQRLWFVLSGLALLVYIPLLVEDISLRAKAAVAAVAISLEECVWIFCYCPLGKKVARAKYSTAVDVPHEVDRFAALFIIVLGEYLYQIIVGSPAAIGFNIRLLRAVWTLIIAFCLNWMYLNNDGSIAVTHPLRRSIFASFAWVTLHLPLIAGLLVAGHVSAQTASQEDIHGGELWILCGGLATGMICLYIIALLHRSDDEPGQLILPKNLRLVFRPTTALIMALLPLAHHLNTTSLISILMSLHVLCLLWENITSLMKGAALWERWDVEHTRYPENSTNHYPTDSYGRSPNSLTESNIMQNDTRKRGITEEA